VKDNGNIDLTRVSHDDTWEKSAPYGDKHGFSAGSRKRRTRCPEKVGGLWWREHPRQHNHP
jgi:hypothetical protein